MTGRAAIDAKTPRARRDAGALPRARRDAGAVATRRCIATGHRVPQERLVRFVVDPGGALVPDVAGALPGRGLWVSAERAALTGAIARGLFARQARRPLVVPADLVDEVERQLAARALNLLGFARRGGAFVTGFDNVKRAVVAGRVAVLIEAADAGPHGGAKLRSAAPAGLPVITLFGRDELGRSIGRGAVVHAALAPGRIADQFLTECARLAGLRAGRTSPAEPGATPRRD